MSNTEEVKHFQKGGIKISKNQMKFAFFIFTAEILIAFSACPLIILWKTATESYLGENTELRYSDEYEPADKENAPHSYGLAEVTFNSDNTVKSEKYYTMTGTIQTLNYTESSAVRVSAVNVFNIVLAVFAFAGVLTGVLANMQIIKKEMRFYGAAAAVSVLIIMMLRTAFDAVFRIVI